MGCEPRQAVDAALDDGMVEHGDHEFLLGLGVAVVVGLRLLSALPGQPTKLREDVLQNVMLIRGENHVEKLNSYVEESLVELVNHVLQPHDVSALAGNGFVDGNAAEDFVEEGNVLSNIGHGSLSGKGPKDRQEHTGTASTKVR